MCLDILLDLNVTHWTLVLERFVDGGVNGLASEVARVVWVTEEAVMSVPWVVSTIVTEVVSVWTDIAIVRVRVASAVVPAWPTIATVATITVVTVVTPVPVTAVVRVVEVRLIPVLAVPSLPVANVVRVVVDLLLVLHFDVRELVANKVLEHTHFLMNASVHSLVNDSLNGLPQVEGDLIQLIEFDCSVFAGAHSKILIS